VPPPMTPSHAPQSSFVKRSPSQSPDSSSPGDSGTASIPSPQSLIETQFPAYVLVSNTPSVSNSLSLNSLTLPQLLTPFRHHKHLYTRTLSHSYEMNGNWDLRFVSLDEMRGGVHEMRMWSDYVNRVVKGVSHPSHHDADNQNDNHVQREEPQHKQRQSYHHTKQFSVFRSEFLTHAIDISEASTMRHPVGLIFAISAHDDSIEELIRMEQRAAQVLERRYCVDLDVCRYYVLFHDENRERSLRSQNNGKSSSRDPHTLYELMKKRFGPQSCKLVHINTRQEGETAVSDIWTPHMSKYEQYVRGGSNTELQTPLSANNITTGDASMTNSFSGGKYSSQPSTDKKRTSQKLQSTEDSTSGESGQNTTKFPPVEYTTSESPSSLPLVGQLLSMRDIQNLEQLIDDMVRNGILPAMQLKIENIHNNVAGKYGGKLKNIAKYFGFGSARRKTSEEAFGVDSAEMQIIRLADYMFLLRDYHAALQNYLKLRDDLKSHKKLYASINESVALSTLMYSGATKEAEQAIAIAYESYLECGENKFAMRAALFRALIFELREQHQLAAESYIDASQIFNDNFYRAILYEQSALCFQSCNVPMMRKFVFYNCCASYNYSNGDAMKLAFRCHRSAMQAAKRSNCVAWSNLHQMMNLTMARLELHRGRLKEALHHYHICLDQPTTVIAELDQNVLFEEYKSAVLAFQRMEGKQTDKNNQPQTSFPHFEDLHTPRIVNNSVRIFLNNFGEWEAIGGNSSFDEKWSLMEEDVVRFIHKRVPFSRYNTGKENTCAVGRPIRFEIQLSNPLSIPLDVTNLSPIWTFSPSQSEEGSDAAGAADTDDITTHPLSVQVAPNSGQSIVLNMVAHKKGKLVIRGVKWTLGGVAEGRVRFHLQGKRLNNTKQQRASVEYEKDHRLHVNIVDPLPRLSLTPQRDMPSSLLNGQITRQVITVRNEGKLALKNLCVKCNLPQVVCFGAAPNGNKVENSTIHNDSVAVRSVDLIHSVDEDSKGTHRTHSRDLSIYRVDLGPSGELAPEESVDLILFLRGSACGTYDLRMLFAYEPADIHKHTPYRLHQWRHSLSVDPSLLLHTYTQPSVEDVSKFSLTLTVTNSTLLHTMIVQQVVGYSKDWILKPIAVQRGDCEIQPNEGVVLHFSIEKRPENDSNTESGSLFTQATVPINTSIENALDCFGTVHWDLLRRNILDTVHRGTTPLSMNFDDGSIAMLMLWSIKGAAAECHGQLDIPQLQFQPSHIKGSGPPCPLQIVVEYDQETEGFTEENKSIHFLPVSIHIMNDSVSTATSTCVVELLHDETSTSTDYVWVGCRRRKFDVKPGQTVSLFTQACFFRPGVYNLNRFRVQWLPKKYLGFESHQFLCNVKRTSE